MRSSFLAGVAKTDITPSLGTLINGDFVSHYARSVHDRLYVKALVMQQKETTIAIVVVDTCAMTKDFADDSKSEITRHTGIARENILIAGTHIHSGGSITEIFLGAADLSYSKKLPALLVKAVKEAQQKLSPAKIAFGSVDAPEHVVCRRYWMKKDYKARNPVTGGLDEVKTNPIGNEDQIEKRVNRVDTGLNFIGLKRPDDSWISLLGNYSMHYVGDAGIDTVTADYFGVFAEEIARKLNTGNDFIAILTNGTSGDANIWDFMEPDRYPKKEFEKSALIGNDLAEKVFQSISTLNWENDPALSVQYEEIPVAVRKPSAAELVGAAGIVAKTDYEKLVPDEKSMVCIYAREQVLLNEFPDSILFPVHSIKIGSGGIGGLGGEFFAATGLWLKENISPNKYFTICLANGYVGYVPREEELTLGGYETWRCRTSCLEVQAEKIIRNKLYELSSRMFDTLT